MGTDTWSKTSSLTTWNCQLRRRRVSIGTRPKLGTSIGGIAVQSEFFGWLSMQGEGGREFDEVASMYAVCRDSPCAGSGGGGPEVPRGEHKVEVLEFPTGERVSLDGDSMGGSAIFREWSFSSGRSASISAPVRTTWGGTSFRQLGVLDSRRVGSNGSIGGMILSQAI